MSGVTTSSLSLAWSLRNWVILDYEEPNGLTVRPWAPFLLSLSFSGFHFLALSLSVSWRLISQVIFRGVLVSTVNSLPFGPWSLWFPTPRERPSEWEKEREVDGVRKEKERLTAADPNPEREKKNWNREIEAAVLIWEQEDIIHGFKKLIWDLMRNYCREAVEPQINGWTGAES